MSAESSGETVAVIPARGGSKGVHRKNLREVGGVPLIARAIAAARAADGIDRVVVSTDDPEIAAVAREWGAEVVVRPAELSGDTASSESALLHVLDELKRFGIGVGILVFVQATSPFIDPADLDAAIERVRVGESDSVFSAVESWGFLWRVGPSGATGINHDPRSRPRRQDRAPELLETGAFYVMDAAGFRSARHRFFGRIGAVLVPETHAIEIDTELQLELASAIALALHPQPAVVRRES
jgi:N-acylneuraminate cytidylyltransferase